MKYFFLLLLLMPVVFACQSGSTDVGDGICVYCPAGMHIEGKQCVINELKVTDDSLSTDSKIALSVMLVGIIFLGLKNKKRRR